MVQTYGRIMLRIVILGALLMVTDATDNDVGTYINLTIGTPIEITSRDYPSIYPPSYTDIWLVVSPQDSLIAIKVLDFQTEKSTRAKDNLYIGDGLNTTLIETGIRLPVDSGDGTAGMVSQLISSGNEAWLRFDSDIGDGNERGFRLQLQAVHNTESCSDDEHACHGEAMMVCLNESSICDGPPQCTDGSDEVTCGMITSSFYVITTPCPKSLAAAVNSTQVYGNGCSHWLVAAIEHCGRTSIDLSQEASYTLTSPKFPDDFPSNIVCHWLINASDASSILLSFVYFSLEESDDLFSLGIGPDPGNVTTSLVMRTGNQMPQKMAVNSSQIWISFETGGQTKRSLIEVELQEFQPKVCGEGSFLCDSGMECIQQTAVCDGWPDCFDQSDEFNCDSCPSNSSTCSCFQASFFCNGVKECDDYYDEIFCAPCGEAFYDLTTMTSPLTLTSPYYPETYPRQIVCLWLITAAPNHRILVNFTDFILNIETLSLGNGHLPSNASSLILRRHGATTPRLVSSEGEEMWIAFETIKTTLKSLYRGYSLELSQFQTVQCNDDEFACASGHQCVHNSTRCDDVIDCWDFTDEYGCALCNSNQLACFTSEVCVEYDEICNGRVQCNDFKDETSCGTLCGDTSIFLTAEEPTYRLASVDYLSTRERYPPAYSCLWLISTDQQLQLLVTVVDIYLTARSKDAIQIGDGHDPSVLSSMIAILEKKDDKKGRSFVSTGSEMWIVMVTKEEDIKYASWGMFHLQISRHNKSGECEDGVRCRYDSICIPETATCDGISNCRDYSDEQYCAHCTGGTSGDIMLSNDTSYLLTARLKRQPTLFPLGKDCLWFVTAHPGHRIQLRFIYLILISDIHYYFNGVKIGDGSNPGNESSMFFTHTGKAVREVVTSSSSDIWIVVETFRLQFEEGFSVLLSQFETAVCDPDQYACPSGLMCIQESQQCDGVPDCPDAADEYGCADCSHDQLHCDGGTCIGADKICNRKSDCQDNLDERICAPCGDSIVQLPRDPDEPIIFSSPSYSTSNYPWDMSCTWYLTGLDGYLIHLEFLDFKTEINFDKFSIGNGHDPDNSSSVILREISGEEAPSTVLSDDNLMWIRFTSDHSITDRGFQLSVTQVNTTVDCTALESTCASGPGVVCMRHESSCNGITLCLDGSDEQSCGICGSTIIYLFGAETYNLTSPGFPLGYPATQECNWQVQASEKPSEDSPPWRLLATIHVFDLENQYDYLTLYNLDQDQDTKSPDQIARLTGKVRLTTIVSSGQAMFVKFTSDNTGSGKGFMINFKPVNKTKNFCTNPDFDCGGDEFCVTDSAQCNGFNDCLQYQDETNCAEINCPGDYMCENIITTDTDLQDFQCVTWDLVCNGRTDCPEHDDEKQCDKKKCPTDSGCRCGYDNNGLSIKCLGSWDQRTVDNMAKTVATLSLNGGNVTVLRKGTFKGMRSLRTLSLSDNNIITIEERTFDGLENLTLLELSENNISELESFSFKELGNLEVLTLWSVPVLKIQTDAFAGLEKLEQLTLVRGLADVPIEVEKNGFDGLTKLKKLYVDYHRLCCYFQQQDVECISLEAQQPLFKCSNLMPNLTLRIFMWILGISALVGNFGIMVWRFREKNTKTSRQVHSRLVFNLAVSDFLMGVYMVIIASADVYYGDTYFEYSSEWRSTVVCKIASVLSIVSSEASVFIVTVITLDRFLCIVFPFGQMHLRSTSSRIVLLAIWCIVIIVGVVPTVLADEESSIYGLSDVCIGLPLQKRATDFDNVAQNIESPLSNVTFSIPVALNYQPSWVFSIVLFLGVNLVCFLIILVCYVVIFVQVQRSLKQVNRHMHRYEEIKMAGKMALIVGTDLVCWLPIVIMGILAQAGAVTIPVDMYAWIVVFILPINSSLNPYLYTVSSCIAERKHHDNASTATNKTNVSVAMTSTPNLEKNVQSKEFSAMEENGAN